MGIFLYNSLTMLRQLPAWLGFPGPGEITIFLYFFFNISYEFILSFLITSTFLEKTDI